MSVTPLTHWRLAERAADPDAEEGTLPVDDERVAVTPQEAEEAWAAAAVPVLTEVAGTYHGLIMHTDLAAAVQSHTGISTRSSPNSWTGRVLAQVAAADVEAGRPPLSSLVVHKTHGTVGEAYDEVLRASGQDPIADDLQREKHAAAARMDCYRWAGASLPSDGGNPALSPRYDMIVTRERRRAREEAEPNVCPTCFMAIPPTGVCDNCG